MATNSSISWCHDTINPWIGCQKIATGCKNCYAANTPPAKFARSKNVETFGPADTTSRKRFKHWEKKLRSFERMAKKAGERYQIVFNGSTCDIFEDNPQVDDWRDEYLNLLPEYTFNLIQLLLTKRPGNVARNVPVDWLRDWPEGIAIGTSVSVQEDVDKFIPELLSVPA